MENQSNKFVNYFKILGVSYLCDTSNLKSAYYAKAHLHHPDKGGKPKQFDLIKKAYDVLNSKESKKNYIKKNVHNLFNFTIQNGVKRVVLEPKKTGYGTASSPLILGSFEKIWVEDIKTIFYVPTEKKQRYIEILN